MVSPADETKEHDHGVQTGSTLHEAGQQSATLDSWQSKLLPLMAGMLVLLTAFFIAATFWQAIRMQDRIENTGSLHSHVTEEMLSDSRAGIPHDEQRWRASVRLETYSIHSRYRQAGLILMSRVWIIYLGFVTGMILALVGATFILGKLREPESTLGADTSVAKFSVSTASPGIILAVLGTVLMTTTMVIRADVNVSDAPLYVGPEVKVIAPGNSGTTAPEPTPKNVEPSGSPDDSELDDIDRDVAENSSDS